MKTLLRRRCGFLWLCCLAGVAFIAAAKIGTYLVRRNQQPPRAGIIQLDQNSVNTTEKSIGLPGKGLLPAYNPNARSGSQRDILSLFNGRLLYNRVPKGGSMVFSQVISALGAENHHDFTAIVDANHAMRQISKAEQAEFVGQFNNISHAKPLIYIRHMYFINFSEFGQPMPMYMNIVREPLERMVSHYYYFKNGVKSAVRNPKAQVYNLTLDECLKLKRTPFNRDHCPNPELWNDELLYFCGNDEICSGLTEATLAIAKSNVQQYYSVVGIHEDLPSLFDVLDVIAPSIFRKTSTAYARISETARARFATSGKIPPSPETAALLKQKAALEYEFYDFIKQRFYKLKAHVLG